MAHQEVVRLDVRVDNLEAVEQLQQAQQLRRHVDGDGLHDASVRVLQGSGDHLIHFYNKMVRLLKKVVLRR